MAVFVHTPKRCRIQHVWEHCHKLYFTGMLTFFAQGVHRSDFLSGCTRGEFTTDQKCLVKRIHFLVLVLAFFWT